MFELPAPVEQRRPTSASLQAQPGPELAAALAAVDPDDLSGADLIDYIAGCERLAGWVAAAQLTSIAELTRRRPAPEHRNGWEEVADRGRGPVEFSEFAADEVAAALRLSRVAAINRVDLAVDLDGRLPATVDALRAGQIDLVKARAVSEATTVLDTAGAGAVEDRVLPRAAEQTVGALRASLRRAVIAVDPHAAEARRERAARERTVRQYPGEDGMATLWACLPAECVAAMWAAIEQVARRGVDVGDTRSMDARRADALFELVLGHATAAEGQSLVHVTVPAGTLLGFSDEPGDLAGFGPVTPEVARRIAADARWRRVLTDPASGTVLDVGRTTYQPPAGMADHVRARDRRCRFPGCRQPAHRCDLDHTVRYPLGPTSVCNLGALCRHHHRLKHETLWRVEQDEDGVFTWTSPTGHIYITFPDGLGPPGPAPGHISSDRLRHLFPPRPHAA